MGQDTYCKLVVSTEPIALTKQNFALISRLYDCNVPIVFQLHQKNKYGYYLPCSNEIGGLSDIARTYCGDNNDNDYIVDASKPYETLMHKLLLSKSEEEFETRLDDLKEMSKPYIIELINESKLFVWFQLTLLECEERNLSRRLTPHTYNEHKENPLDLVKNICDLVEYFKDNGVPKDKIKLGYKFLDSF